MIWNPIDILRTFTAEKKQAAEIKRRWTVAARSNAALAADVMRLGGILVLPPDDFVNGVEQRTPIDPSRLAYEAGRRDLALKLLALMDQNHLTLNALMENNDV